MILLRERPDRLIPTFDKKYLDSLEFDDLYIQLYNFFTFPEIDVLATGMTFNKPRQWGKSTLGLKLLQAVPNSIMITVNIGMRDSLKRYQEGRNNENRIFSQSTVNSTFLNFNNKNIIFDELNNVELDILHNKVYPKRWICLTTPR